MSVVHIGSCLNDWSLVYLRRIRRYVIVGECLSQDFYSCTNIMTKKQVGEERVYIAYTPQCCSSLKEVTTRTQAGLEAAAVAEAMEGCSLCACFL